MPANIYGQTYGFNPAGTSSPLAPSTASNVPGVAAPSTASSLVGGSTATPYLAWIGAIVLALVGLHLLQRWSKFEVRDDDTRVTVHNFVAVGLLATLFILTLKIIINKYASGNTPLANVVNSI